MELNIKVKKNDFVKPTELREPVVQAIVDYVMKYLIHEHEECYKSIAVKNNEVVYLDDGCLKKIPRGKLAQGIRVHSVEMDAAFDVLKEAGYYFYASYNVSYGIHSYMFSEYPMNGRTETPNAHFALCID